MTCHAHVDPDSSGSFHKRNGPDDGQSLYRVTGLGLIPLPLMCLGRSWPAIDTGVGYAATGR